MNNNTNVKYYIYGRCKSSKNNTKIIQVNNHDYVKIHKRLSSIIHNKIIEFSDTKIDNTELEGNHEISSIINKIYESMPPEDIKKYTNFALSFAINSSQDSSSVDTFVFDKLYVYNSFSYYDFFGIESLFDPNNLI
jgi:hypothetical protein